MSKPKLDLYNKNDAEIIALATEHQASMTGNPNFVLPMPSAEDFAAVLDEASGSMDEVAALYIAWRTAVAKKDERIAALRRTLTCRAAYVEAASEGDEARILSSGFAVRAPKSSPSALPAPGNPHAGMGSKEGEIDVSWDRVAGADSYVLERSPNVLPRAWDLMKIVTQSSFTASGLVSGQTYVFRMAAVGPLGQGPWSDEAKKMAP